MSMNKREWILVGGVIFLLILFFRECNSKNETIGNGKDLINYKDTVAFYKSKSGKLVASNKALHMSYNDATYYIDSLERYLKDLKIKKPSVIIRTVTVFRVDSIPVPFNVELPCDEFNLLTRLDSTWYKFDIKLTKRSLLISNLEIPNKQESVVGIKKNGLFKRDEYTVAVINSNPYMKVESIGALTIKPKKKLLDKWFVKVGIFAGGIFLGTKIN